MKPIKRRKAFFLAIKMGWRPLRVYAFILAWSATFWYFAVGYKWMIAVVMLAASVLVIFEISQRYSLIKDGYWKIK